LRFSLTGKGAEADMAAQVSKLVAVGTAVKTRQIIDLLAPLGFDGQKGQWARATERVPVQIERQP